MSHVNTQPKNDSPSTGDRAEAAPRLRRGDDGRLFFLTENGAWKPVLIRPCFPWTLANRFLSLRDEENNEHALVADPEELPEESREALLGALADTRFTFEIESVHQVETDFELRVWRVRTAQGDRTFCTKTDDWPDRLDDGRIVFRDLGGDLFVIPDLETLDARSRRILWSYVV
ncbi:MAG: DUF1854 domain-containing protein [Opitutales bacterium]|nr:DUF1854 domain-containing protein [Opitutales bacterium]